MTTDKSSEREAFDYATRLAQAIHAKHYSEVTQWRPLPDLLGVLTQIDNMTCGLARAARAALPQQAQEALDARRYRWLRAQSHPWTGWYSLEVLDNRIDAAIAEGEQSHG